MPIDLVDLRSAVKAYVTQVPAGTSPATADVGGTINPGEEFSFTAHVKNFPLPSGIGVINVIYHIQIDHSSIAELKVPASPPARASRFQSEPLLVPGSFVQQMFLFPADNSLGPGDSDEIPGLKGRANSIGITNLRCHIHGDLDLDSIFPKDNTTESGNRTVRVE